MADLSKLPRVDRVAQHAVLAKHRARLGSEALTRLARRGVEMARDAARRTGEVASLDDVAQSVAALAEDALRARARPVINATGILLHTNLGRAPLPEVAVDALASGAGRYTSIEIDLATGKRGARGAFAERALAELTGAEAALVVNNNAAAVLLALSALAMGKRVLVSRGELIEIGGGFRVPDVCARSGATLVEVGTTNKTRLADYARALDEGGVGAILRVHPGNFRQSGFVERPLLGELADLARARGVLLIKDLGGGALIDLAPYGLDGEPLAQTCVAAGCDIVCFSGDKVLGGPQAGVLVGRADAIERARRDPLARALRLGRLPLVALEATLACFQTGELDRIPALRAIRRPLAQVVARAERWRDELSRHGLVVEVTELEVEVGGGALADRPLASAGVSLATSDATALLARLRANEPPIFARIQGDRALFDARSVLPDEDSALLEGIVRAASFNDPAARP